MANTLTKIEKDGKAEQVNQWLTNGVKSASKIHRLLTDDGYDISKGAVQAYIKKAIDHIKPEAFKIISDHIDMVIPDDMDALESMEAQLLLWAKETPIDAADRLADARGKIERETARWISLITGPIISKKPLTKDEELQKRITNIIRTCLFYILADARLQKKRIEAMNTAIRIIGLKLQHIAALEGSGRGDIVIVDSSAEYKDPEEDDGYSEMSVPTPDSDKVVPIHKKGNGDA